MGNACKLLKAWVDERFSLWHNPRCQKDTIEGITIGFEPKHFVIYIINDRVD